MSEKLTLKENIEKYTEVYRQYVKDSNYEGGLEYFMGEVIDCPTFEALAFEIRMYAFCAYREHKKFTFRVSSCKDNIDSAFTMYSNYIKKALDDAPNLKRSDITAEIVESLSYLKESLISSHETYLDWKKTENDVIQEITLGGICCALHELAFYLGEKTEELGCDDLSKDMQMKCWKAGCEMMQLYEDAGYEEDRDAYLRRKLYTDKIRQVDTEYPEYELHYIAKTLEEKLEICKIEKKLKRGTVYSSYAEKCFVVPEGIEIIEESAISGSAIEEIIIPASVKKIERYAFFQCKQLKKFIVPANSELESIGEYALYYTSLETIKIPQNCEVKSNALFGCDVKRITPIDKIIQKITEAIKKQK